MNIKSLIIASAVSATLAGMAQAATSDEIKQLGTTLTPWGAEIAGNKEGTYPAYTGGLQKTVKEAYPNEKPILVIDAKNMAQYADKLTIGTQELMKRFPTFQAQVYPTHRTYWMRKEGVENTLKNATNPECKTVADGVGMRGCFAGTPFPIPKTGYEVMWNSILREHYAFTVRHGNWLVDASGHAIMTNDSESIVEYPYWDYKQKPYEGRGLYNQRFVNTTFAPARDAGSKTTIWYPLKADSQDQLAWSYTTGQRRVRVAPEFAYDTPSVSLSGAMNYDEIGGWKGRMDRFDFKIAGKKELYLPYSQYDVLKAPHEKLLGKQHANPDFVRWELHRFWIVEATRKAGKRHIAAKRIIYIDEDGYGMLAADSIDDSGKIFRVHLSHTTNLPTGGTIDTAGAAQIYDLTKGQYLVVGVESTMERPIPTPPDFTFSPEAMAGSGVR